MLYALLIFAEQASDTPASDDKGGGGGPSGILSFLPLIAIGILFWLLLLRPMKRQQAQREALVSNLKKNDKVVTTSGLIGWIVSVADKEDEVVVRLDDNVKVRMIKSAIAQNLSQQEAAAQEKK